MFARTDISCRSYSLHARYFFSQPYCIYAAHATGTSFGFNIEYRAPQKVAGEETISGGIYIGK